MSRGQNQRSPQKGIINNSYVPMHHLEILISLPSTLSCIVLREWLNFRSVMALNSACCCHSYRNDFLDLLQSDEYFIRERVTVNLKGSKLIYSHMFKNFGEKIRSVELMGGRYDCSLLEECLASEHCINLTQIKVSDRVICEPGVSALLRVNPQIESVSFYHPIRETLREIQLPKLSTLRVHYYPQDKFAIIDAIKMGNIVRLSLFDIKAGSDLIDIGQNCPWLRALRLLGTKVTDKALQELTVICPHIVHLDISGARFITDAGVLAAVLNLKGLRHLNLLNVPRLTDATLVHIYTHCAYTLRTLLLNRGDDEPIFSSYSINTLLERCSHLRNLFFRDVTSLDPPMRHIFSPAALQHLTTLVIEGSVVSDQNLAIISAYGVHLQVLILEDICQYQYTYDILSALVNGCSQLKFLYYCLHCADMYSIPENLLPVYWMNFKPGLFATTKYGSLEHWNYMRTDFHYS